MVSLVTIEDIEVALGRTASNEAEEAKWQQRIDQISAFIDGYVDCSLEELADDAIRAQADYYGVIELGGDPISTVTSVNHFGDSTAYGIPYWDGMNTIYGLAPMEVVDIIYSHGYESVPEEIKGVALDAVLAVLGIAEQGSSGPIRQFTVGDVTEAYAFSKGEDGATFVNVSISGQVLNNYRQTAGTYRVGGPGFPPGYRYGGGALSFQQGG